MLSRDPEPGAGRGARRATPVVVIADPADCSLQFDPVGKASLRVVLRHRQVRRWPTPGVSYTNRGRPGRPRRPLVRIGDPDHPVDQRRGPARPTVAKAVKTAVESRHRRPRWPRPAIPAKADPARMNLVGAVRRAAGVRDRGHRALRADRRLPGRAVPDPGALHGHVAALPHRHRLGGRLRALHRLRHRRGGRRRTSTPGSGTRFAFTAVSVVVCLFLLPETKGKPLS